MADNYDEYMQKLVEKYELTANSTPCEICNAMNGLEVTVEQKEISTSGKKHNPKKPVCERGLSYPFGGSVCLDKDKAMTKLYFLQLAKDYL